MRRVLLLNVTYEPLTTVGLRRAVCLVLCGKHQVLHDEPRPPRALNDQVPRNLETICVQAMAQSCR